MSQDDFGTKYNDFYNQAQQLNQAKNSEKGIEQSTGTVKLGILAGRKIIKSSATTSRNLKFGQLDSTSNTNY